MTRVISKCEITKIIQKCIIINNLSLNTIINVKLFHISINKGNSLFFDDYTK